MFSIDNKDIKRLEQDLKRMAYRALPFATKQTINDAAYNTMEIARADVKKNMTVRNSYTIQSIQYKKTKTLKINRQISIVGSTAEYMAVQEFGGTKVKKGKEGVTIPTSYASGEAENARPRLRMPPPKKSLNNIKLTNRRKKYSNSKQRNLVAVKQAADSGRKFVFMNLGRRKGIFEVVNKKKGIKIKMMYDMSKQAVHIPKNPWLRPSVEHVKRMIPAFYADALRFQLRRRGIFKG